MALDEKLYSRLNIPRDAFVITAMGRAVKRKGFSWFVANVLPHMPSHVVFVLIGPVTSYGKNGGINDSFRVGRKNGAYDGFCYR